MSQSQVGQILDHLFRRQSGQMVAYLTRFFGTDHLDLAETVVQEALLKAVQSWPISGIPENPKAWIIRAAKNSAIDHFRKQHDSLLEPEIFDKLADGLEDDDAKLIHTMTQELKNDDLKLLFICCHSSLGSESRTALTLKTVCGFSVKEVARAFLSKEETIAQRLVRAKKKIAEEKLKYEVPPPSELEARLDSVLEVLYLLFNEGYLATDGESLIRKDLCDEAIYRTTVLAQHSVGQQPKVFALLALMHLQASRFQARTDSAGDLLLLEEQDRSLWDQEHIGMGLKYLEMSAQGNDLTEFHLQAGIASCHAIAPSFEETDWQNILSYYDMLFDRSPSPIVALNRSVALGMVRGMAAGISEVLSIKESGALSSYYLLSATLAEFYRRDGNYGKALGFYHEALSLVGTEPERRLIEKRIKTCKEKDTNK
ncbi:MAG: sigma-70 family RNA polymerase sigma factor [Bdellovibrionaceae bacterium]|nr:sigma-70 family RNA polymerase sigma factor [Pseudobdellovibrionaceae bacterium]